jgi:hypothetical protein
VYRHHGCWCARLQSPRIDVSDSVLLRIYKRRIRPANVHDGCELLWPPVICDAGTHVGRLLVHECTPASTCKREGCGCSCAGRFRHEFLHPSCSLQSQNLCVRSCRYRSVPAQQRAENPGTALASRRCFRKTISQHVSRSSEPEYVLGRRLL